MSKLDENVISYILFDAPRAALQNDICDFSVQEVCQIRRGHLDFGSNLWYLDLNLDLDPMLEYGFAFVA